MSACHVNFLMYINLILSKMFATRMTVAYLKVQSLHPSYINFSSERMFVLRSLPLHIMLSTGTDTSYCTMQ